MRVQSVGHTPVKETRQLGSWSQVVARVSWRLEHPLDVSLLRSPAGGGPPQLEGPLVEHDGVEI